MLPVTTRGASLCVLLPLAGCRACAPDEPLPFDWPTPVPAAWSWDLRPLAPVTATATIRLVVGGNAGETRRERTDVWRLEVAGPDTGRVVHEMSYRGPRAGPRTEREELVARAGRVASRRGRGELLARPDDELWRAWLARPGEDFSGLLQRADLPEPAPDGARRVARGEGGEAVLVLADGVVRRATLTATGEQWEAHFDYAVEADRAEVPQVDAASPHRDRPLPRRRRVLAEEGP